MKHISCQDQKIIELSTKMESDSKEHKALWDQVELQEEINSHTKEVSGHIKLAVKP